MKIKGSLIKRNVVSNLIGTAAVTILTVAITPLQIKLLGIEAYGIVGFIATLQVIFAVFDLGLSSTLTRELAIDSSPKKLASHSLVSTVTGVYWIVAIAISLLIIMYAEPISRWWFHDHSMNQATLSFSLSVIGLYLGLRWPVAMYVGILSGLQRMDILNLIKVGIAVFRLGGGIAVLLIWGTLDAFLVWIVISAILELACYWLVCRKIFPGLSLLKGFSFQEIRRVWKFSVSMNALSLMAIIIIQMDRLMISKLDSLEILGYYNFAYMAVSGLGLVLSAINSSVVPWLASSLQVKPEINLLDRYEKSALLILLVVGFFASAMIFYPYLLLSMWVDQVAALNSYKIFLLLALGSWISAINANLYNVAIASGKPYWHLRINAILIVPYSLALYFLIVNYGGIGAASGWILLNVLYMLFLSKPISVNILGINTSELVKAIILPSLAVALISYGPLKLIANIGSFDQFGELSMLLVSALIYIGLGYFALPKSLKLDIFGNKLKNIF